MAESVFDRRLIWSVLLLAFVVVVVGAYVRLSDAGLGCPDWPGCYGHLTVPSAAAEQQTALENYPGAPVEVHKAWKEMGHRYIAGLLGLLIGVIAVRAWLKKSTVSSGLASALLVLVIGQALLGMWTVTLKLQPVIVLAHLLGGMSTLGLLLLLALNQSWRPTACQLPSWLRWFALTSLMLLVAQIALGGWTSSNYAALACLDLPTCQGSWWPEMAFAEGFQLIRELGQTADGAALPHAALVAIHVIHRIGAVLTVLVIGLLALLLMRSAGAPRRYGQLLLLMVSLQFALGLSNVWFALPLPVAAAHNGGAALLLLLMIGVNFGLFKGWCKTQNV